MREKTDESPSITSKMDDVAEAVAAVKRDLVEELPKMRRAGRTDVSDLAVSVNALTPVSETALRGGVIGGGNQAGQASVPEVCPTTYDKSMLAEPRPVAGPTMIAVAAIGVVINTLTALLFVRGHHDANIRGAFLHMAADAAISLGVVVAGIGIVFTGLAWIDPVVSIVITLVIVVGTWGLFTESVDLALDAVPRGIDIDAVEAALAAVPGVAGVRDLRVWGASTSEASLTAHLVVPHGGDAHATLAAAAEAVLRQRFRITHTTIQIEP